jgi:hypothetical protein
MNRNTSDELVAGSFIQIAGEWDALVTRADGSVEERSRGNIVTRAGLNRFANRMVAATATTPINFLGIGSYTTGSNPASLDSTNFGELSRKVTIAGSSAAQSREWVFLSATWAGAADSVTSKTIDSAALLDHANSGSGIVVNIVQGLGVTLADSDFLALTCRIRVGSHDLAHST